MHRRLLLLGACLILGSAAWTADVQHVTIVLSSDAAPYRSAAEAIEASLGGQTPAQTLLLDRARPDVLGASPYLVAIGSTAASALRLGLQANQHLAYCLVSDPAAAGLTGDARIAGVSATVPFASQFALLAQAHPRCKRLGLLYMLDDAAAVTFLAAVNAGLPPGWELKAVAVAAPDRIAAAIEAVTTDTDAVWTYADSTLFNDATVRTLLLTALRRKVAVFGFSSAFVRAGALVGVGIDPVSQGQQVAAFLLPAVRGGVWPSKPIDPIHHVALNLIVAEKLGIAFPSALIESSQLRYGER